MQRDGDISFIYFAAFRTRKQTLSLLMISSKLPDSHGAAWVDLSALSL